MDRARICFAVLCVSAPLLAGAGAHAQPAANSAGVSGATRARPAVPDSLNVGRDVQTVQNYDLDAASAQVNQTVGNADTQRDQEIDQILNGLDSGKPAKAAPPAAKPAAVRRPAVPPGGPRRLPAVSSSDGTALGITASIRTSEAQPMPSLPPLPASVTEPKPHEDQALAAEQAQLFPKPRWRRELAAQRSQTTAQGDQPPSH